MIHFFCLFVLWQLWLWLILSVLRQEPYVSCIEVHRVALAVCICSARLVHYAHTLCFCLLAVCDGHHRTEVHLPGHRIPGALLADGHAGNSHTHIKAIPCRSGAPLIHQGERGHLKTLHWSLNFTRSPAAVIPLNFTDKAYVGIGACVCWCKTHILTNEKTSFTPFPEHSLNQSPESWQTCRSNSIAVRDSSSGN